MAKALPKNQIMADFVDEVLMGVRKTSSDPMRKEAAQVPFSVWLEWLLDPAYPKRVRELLQNNDKFLQAMVAAYLGTVRDYDVFAAIKGNAALSVHIKTTWEALVLKERITRRGLLGGAADFARRLQGLYL